MDEEALTILKIRSYTVKIQDTNETDAYTYTLGPGDLPLYTTPKDDDVRNAKQMHNQGMPVILILGILLFIRLIASL